jgi:hypothetical protein
MIHKMLTYASLFGSSTDSTKKEQNQLRSRRYVKEKELQPVRGAVQVCRPDPQEK